MADRKKFDDGGPAFPNEALIDQGYYYPKAVRIVGGMSLRDWFAGMALAEVPDPIGEKDAPKTAMLAYAIADAMIALRRSPIPKSRRKSNG